MPICLPACLPALQELHEEGITFKPEINRRSVHLVAQKARQQPGAEAGLTPGERLYQEAMNAKKRCKGGRVWDYSMCAQPRV